MSESEIMTEKYCFALMGNPNCGKTTIFNQITGMHQHVGNWPGKTVEKKEGYAQHKGVDLEIVDLPGTYSLTAFSMEEVISRDFILDNHPDVIIAVVDSCNLERNLYLTVQILELGVPLVLVLNMTDVAESKGLKIDTDSLSKALQSPVVKTTASSAQGITDLLDTAINLARNL